MGVPRKVGGWFKSFSCITFTFLIVLLAHNSIAFGQVDQGSITGAIQDTTGAVVPNAKVTLLNTDVGLTSEVISDSAGRYTFSPLRIGHYTVTATAKGFA